MPIQEQNIVFVESQVMDDVPEGGGAATGNVIVDGMMNNIFEDISDLDRTYGRFSLRKIFLAIRTLSTDLFGGAKTLVTSLPTDSALGYTLFTSDDPFDTRADAAGRVEAYLYKGPTWGGYLLENHIAGMRAISLIQRASSPLPVVGKTLCLVQNEGLANEQEQYVRVTKVETQPRVFTDGEGDFTRWIVTLYLSDALRYDFAGHEARRFDANYSYAGKTRVRDTSVADATRYYGSQRLATAAAIGDVKVAADSMFTQLVPSAQTETPLVNQVFNPETSLTLLSGSRTVEVAQQTHTSRLAVTAENRRLNWVETLFPIPAPGVLAVSFRAQGNWYTLKDNGSGGLEGSDPSIGAGAVSYTTGAVTVTLGALPDAGSAILMTWGSAVHYRYLIGADAASESGMTVRYTLAQTPVVPGTVSVSYTVSGAVKTFTDTTADGTLFGDGAAGTINYATGEIEVTFGALPDSGTSFANTYTAREGAGLVAQVTAAPVISGAADLSAGAPYRGAGTCTVTTSIGFNSAAYFTAGGALFVKAGGADIETGRKYWWEAQQIGVINVTTGVVTLTNEMTVHLKGWNYEGGWTAWDEAIPVVALSDVSLEVDTTGFTATAVTESTALAIVGGDIEVAADTGSRIVTGSVEFTMNGRVYIDRGGVLYTDVSEINASGTPAGSFDYTTGRATVTLWTDGGSSNPHVTGCIGVQGDWVAQAASFRAPSSPLKPESLTVTATLQTGGQITGASDASGAIAGAHMRGAVDFESGVAFVEFGTEAGGVWVPESVDPSSMRYNAVSYTYLPLDAETLGVDAVRLPSDGRVPIFRAGDVAMVIHQAETAPATVASGDSIDTGRTRLAWARILDANGAAITTGYTLDRATGIIGVTDTTGWTMPVTVRHAVGDLRQITDVQITGEITFSRALTHDYPAGESLVASCLIHGDRRARVSAVWDQQTWTGEWSDAIVGSDATATLDTIAHPIVVTNEGAETERWILRWTSTTTVELIGEKRGLVYSGPFTADIAPINPRTKDENGAGGVPYLQIPVAANGGGWSTGNVVRINTVGALADIWIARAIQQSEEPAGDGADGCEIYCLGNIDRP